METTLAACLGWVVTTCLLVRLLVARERAADTEREELRTDVRTAQTEIASLARAHAEQLERLTEAHRKEVGNLCQRIQAPEIAVAEHLGQTARDPAQVDLENDQALAEIAKREADMRLLEEQLTHRAEELAAER